MVKRLELEALQADLAAVEGLLSERSAADDPSGWVQYTRRKAELEKEILALGSSESPTAELALFFGGRPVFGSRAISSDFTSRALTAFQNLVSKRYAVPEQGGLASRGRIPQRDRSTLMITDIVHGSFGFVLSEMNQDQELVDSKLKETVDEISAILFRLCAEDAATLDVALDELDSRILAEIRQFFQILSEGGATLRIVEDEKEYLFPDDALRRGRERVERMDITEDDDVEIDGLLYILPTALRFEFLPMDKSIGVLRGTISEEAHACMIGPDGLIKREYIGNTLHSRLSRRIIREHGEILHTAYTLIDITQCA
jgi:hypothetical protein